MNTMTALVGLSILLLQPVAGFTTVLPNHHNQRINEPMIRSTYSTSTSTSTSASTSASTSVASGSSLRMVPSNSPSTTNNNDEDTAAKKLLDRAAQIRAEIAALEGKSIEQVEQEAKDKKDQQLQLKQQQQQLLLQTNQADQKETNDMTHDSRGVLLQVPDNIDDMISMAARSVEVAYRDSGIRTQTVRFALLCPDKDESFLEMNQWPGGPAQMSRESAQPLTQQLLRELRIDNPNGMPPNITTQDILDFDGSAWVTSSDGVAAMVLPNTDAKYVEDIEQFVHEKINIDRKDGEDNTDQQNLMLLINPFWRNLDSWGVNILQPRAKERAQRVLFPKTDDDEDGNNNTSANDISNKPFPETFSYVRLSVRGEDCVALKAYPFDWQLFAYLEDTEFGGRWIRTIRLGSSKQEPGTQLFTELINARPEFKYSKAMRRMQNK